MNFFEEIKDELVKILEAKEEFKEVDFSRMTVEPPREAAHGDVATNIALVLSKQMKKNPKKIANIIVKELKKGETIAKVDVAGPGFINLKMTDKFWHRQLRRILGEKTNYGNSNIGAGKKTNVEFVSVNPTGPMHVGHARGAIYGDALASLLKKAGYDVTREYYINDAGQQVYKLARSTYLRYREALGEDIGDMPSDCYPGDYLKPLGKKIAVEDGNWWMDKDELEWLEYFRDKAIAAMMEIIKDDLKGLGIEFDVFTSERAISESGDIEKCIRTLRDKNLVYEGCLGKPKSKKADDDLESVPMIIFKSTEFGDDSDRPLMRPDGSYTYFAPDIAYHQNKFERGFTILIDVWGADHAGYVNRMKAAVKAVTDEKAELEVKICQMLNFSENGVPVKMSKRSGSFITLKDVLDEVGKDVTRFFILFHKNDTHIEFDFAKTKEQSKDNPIFYVQYAYTRGASVLKLAEEMFGTACIDENINLEELTDEVELELIKTMADFPRQVEAAARTYEPHRIGYYLYDLASLFHKLWNRGKSNTYLRFLNPEMRELSMARAALIKGMMHVIAAGLAIFAVQPLEEM